MLANWFLTIPEPSSDGIRLRLRDLLTVAWQRWRSRRALAELDDHLLRDCGITPAQVDREIDKPFWTA